MLRRRANLLHGPQTYYTQSFSAKHHAQLWQNMYIRLRHARATLAVLSLRVELAVAQNRATGTTVAQNRATGKSAVAQNCATRKTVAQNRATGERAVAQNRATGTTVAQNRATGKSAVAQNSATRKTVAQNRATGGRAYMSSRLRVNVHVFQIAGNVRA
jgi:hypothetical protein